MLYPDITRIRDVSVTVARQVIRQAQKQKLDREKSIRGFSDEKLDAWIKERMYDPASSNVNDAHATASKL
jgi:malate dehydrogenase (oxaloacetate-decarboxylating)(NADP+)